MSNLINRIIFNSGSNISSEAAKAVEQFTYDEERDRLITSSSLQTKPSSLLLGDKFKVSNGIYALSFELGEGTPALGLNMQYDENGSYAPLYYHLDPREELVVNTLEDQTLPDPYNLQYTTFGDNLTFDFRVIPAEAGVLNARFWLGTEKNDENLIFDEVKTFEASDIGVFTNFTVGNKYILPANIPLYVEFSGIKLKGGVVQSGPFAGQLLPAFISQVHPYETFNLVNNTVHVDVNYTIKAPGDYIVDTTSLTPVVINVPYAFKESFSIYDGYNAFGLTSCIINFYDSNGLISNVFTLNSNRDSYKFYWSGSQWRYIDLDARRSGIVT